jgi:geranylgeranyl diphosphate synthase type I
LADPSIIQILDNLWANAGAWPEFSEAMHRTLFSELPNTKPSNEISQLSWSQLPILCCEAAGGSPEYAQPIALAWGLLYTAAHLMDNVADHDELPANLGPGAMINIATGLYATSALALERGFGDDVRPDLLINIQNAFNRAILQMCSGQHLDLIDGYQNLDTCWRVVRAKSGAIFELACMAGAQLATEDAHLIAHYGDYGMHLGMMVQIGDDAAEIWGRRDGIKSRLNCYSVPIAYTMDVLAGEERERFCFYLEHSGNDDQNAARVSEMVAEAGAARYVQTKFQFHSQLSLRALSAAGASSHIYETLAGYVNRFNLRFE